MKRRRLLTSVAVLALLGAGLAYGQQSGGGVFVGSITGLAAGMMNYLKSGAGFAPGSTTGTAVGAGFVGEVAFASAAGAPQAVTMTNATPTVVTSTNSTFAANAQCAVQTGVQCILPIYFTGLGGAVGVTNNTAYYIDPNSIVGCTGAACTFKIATTIPNALAGTDVGTSGTDAGTGNPAAYVTTSGATQSVISLQLTAGSWNCSGNLTETGVASTAPTNMVTGIGRTLNTLGVQDGEAMGLNITFTTGGTQNSFAMAPRRFNSAAVGPMYMHIILTWTGGATNPIATPVLQCIRFA